MSRIERSVLARAISTVRTMSTRQKERLADEILLAQPHMFGSIVVLNQFGVSLEKMSFPLDMLLICFQAMKESGLTWPVITEDEQDCQLQRYIAIIKFGDDLSETLRDRAMQQYIADHPEKELLAYVLTEIREWLRQSVREDSDQYVIMAISNLVNCIAFAPLPAAKATPS